MRIRNIFEESICLYNLCLKLSIKMSVLISSSLTCYLFICLFIYSFIIYLSIYLFIYHLFVFIVGISENLKYEDDRRAHTLLSSTASKTYGSALQELKSSDAAIDFKSRHHGLSKLQIRRKATKMEEIACLYETKTGIKISLGETGNLARSDLSLTLSGEGLEYRASSSIKTKTGHQKAIKSSKVFAVESTQDTGISNLLGFKHHGEKYDPNDSDAGSAPVTPGWGTSRHGRSSVSDGSSQGQGQGLGHVQIQVEDLTQPLSTGGGGQYLQHPKGKGNHNSSSPMSGIPGSKTKVLSEAYIKMENLLSAPPTTKKVLPLHPLDLEKLNKSRENKKILLEKALS